MPSQPPRVALRREEGLSASADLLSHQRHLKNQIAGQLISQADFIRADLVSLLGEAVQSLARPSTNV